MVKGNKFKSLVYLYQSIKSKHACSFSGFGFFFLDVHASKPIRLRTLNIKHLGMTSFSDGHMPLFLPRAH